MIGNWWRFVVVLLWGTLVSGAAQRAFGMTLVSGWQHVLIVAPVLFAFAIEEWNS